MTFDGLRPRKLVVVAGTGTEIGKTWVAARLARDLRATGYEVIARKPAQSFDPGDSSTDAHVLAAATGEEPSMVCPRHRWYPAAMAPPMAADHRPSTAPAPTGATGPACPTGTAPAGRPASAERS